MNCVLFFLNVLRFVLVSSKVYLNDACKFLAIVKNATSSHSIMLSELACSFSQPSSFVFVLSNVYPNDAF